MVDCLTHGTALCGIHGVDPSFLLILFLPEDACIYIYIYTHTHVLSVFEDKVLRKMFGLKRDEVMGVKKTA